MATNYQMDPVVRRINKSERDEAAAEGYVVPVRQGDGWFADTWYYRVANPQARSGWAVFKTDWMVDAAERDWLLPLNVKLTLQFAGPGESDARKLVDAVRHAENADRAMEELIRRWTQQFFVDQSLSNLGFIERFVRLRESLKTHLMRRAYQDAALKVTHVEIAVKGESQLPKVYEISIPSLQVVVQDYPQELTLSVQADLAVVPESVLAYLATGTRETVEREMRSEIRNLFRVEVNLHQWQFDLQGSVRSMVEKTVSGVAARAGREVQRLIISGQPPFPEVERSRDVKIEDEEFRQLDYPNPVRLNVEMRLELTDLGSLVSSGIRREEMKNWDLRTVREAISKHLLNEYYIDLIDKIDAKKEETEQAIEREAIAIGYRLARVVLKTDLDFDVLQRGFDCRIESASFPLSLRECVVVLDIDTKLRIIDRATLRDLFRRNTRIKQTVEEKIREAAADVLRRVTPEEFYLRFHGSADSKEISVASRLEDAIRNACKIFKPDETPQVALVRRPDEQAKVYQVLVRSPLSLPGIQDPNSQVVVDLGASVRYIHPGHWLRFQELKPTPEQVALRVADHVRSFINESTRLNLKSFMSAGTQDMAAEAERWINERLGKELGVGIGIDHWFRHDSFSAKPLRNWEVEVTDLEASLAEISTLLRNAYVQGEPDSVIDELEARKRRIKEKMEALYTEVSTGSILKPVDPSHRIGGGIVPQLTAGEDGKLTRGDAPAQAARVPTGEE